MNSNNAPAISKRARIKARRNTVQALYQWFMTGKDVARQSRQQELLSFVKSRASQQPQEPIETPVALQSITVH